MTKRSFPILAALLPLFVLFVLCFGTTTLAQSQVNAGQIGGTVTDENGAVVPNAVIKVKSKSTGLERSATASGSGNYLVVSLPPGFYTITASGSGFKDTTLANAEVNVGRTLNVDITLSVAGVQAVVSVTADAIQTTRNESDSVLSETAINNLPILGRRFQDFVTLTPTAQVDPQRGQISLSGQRGINANISVDGVDYNQPFFGGIRGGERSNTAFTLPQEAIKEFQVVASGYSAEFGRSSGGVVNAVTKSGGNEVHGSAFYLIRHQKFAAKNDFIRAFEVDRNLQVTPAPTLKQFGGSIGGPVRQDKLFYFFAFEQQRFRADRQVGFGSLNSITRASANQEAYDFYRSLEIPFGQTNDAVAGIVRSDWQINNNNRFNFRYNHSQNKALNGNATGEEVLDPTINRGLSNNGTERNRNHIFVSQLISNFGTSVVNEARFQFAREDRPRLANSFSPQVASSIGTYGTRNFLPTTQFDRRTQVADSLTWIKGDHSIKFGGEFSNIYADQIFGFNQTGAFSTGSGSNDAQLQVLALTPGVTTDRRFDVSGASYLRQIGNLSAAYTSKELSFFGQDSWRIRPNFTINFGLRVDQQFNPEPQVGNQALVDLVRNGSFPIRGGRGFDPTQIPDSGWQVGPRLGFAWDPTKDGKTVIRGFAGVYYARTPLLVLAAPFNNFRDPAGDLSVRLPFALPSGFSQSAFDTANPQYVAIMGTGQSPNTVYRQFAVLGINLNSSPLGSLPILTVAQIRAIALAVNPTVNPLVAGVQPIGMDENFRNPRAVQWGGGFEREIYKDVIFGVDYAYVHTTRLERNRDINLPAPVDLISYIQANNTAAVFAALDQSLLASNRPYIGITRGSGIPSTVSVNGVSTTLNVPNRARPVSALGSVQLRESSAKSLYQALTFRTRVTRKRMLLNAYLTISSSLSDDDNERDAGGTGYDNSFDLRREYGPSRLDRRFQFTANPVFYLPLGIEVASAMRLRSAVPIDTIANADHNGDTVFNDRPFLVPGLALKRNAYRNRAVFDVDLRVQRPIVFRENRRLSITAEIFNLFNRQNIQLSGSTVTAYCSPTTPRCGMDGITNVNFLQVLDQNSSSTRRGLYLLNNNLGSRPLQLQIGFRFQF